MNGFGREDQQRGSNEFVGSSVSAEFLFGVVLRPEWKVIGGEFKLWELDC